MSSRSILGSAVAGVLALSAVVLCGGLRPAPSVPGKGRSASDGRVVVLGFDGADARTVRGLMDSGSLPNLKSLAEAGTFAPLSTTNPAESPVSWSSLNTGQNPAKTGIPGFVVRQLAGDSGIPLPDIGFYDSVDAEPIERLAHTPLPTWPPWVFGLSVGALVLVVFLLVFAGLLRLRARPAVALSLALAGVGVLTGVRMRGYLPSAVPVVKNVLRATPFWEVAARAGVPCVVLDAAQAWDRQDVHGAKVLAGLGVPDARGQYNGFTIYTTDELWFEYGPSVKALTPSAGYKLRVDWKGDRIDAHVYGPSDFWRADAARRELLEVEAKAADPKTPFQRLMDLGEREKELEAELARIESEPLSVPLTVMKRPGGARVAIGDEEQDLDLGQWSGWYRLTFEINPLIKVRALTRVKLLSLDEPDFRLYVDALQIDPEHPPFWQPISQPSGFARELARGIGPFETVGWACMTLPYKDAEVDPVSFMQDIEFTFRWGQALTLERLAMGDWRLFMSCLSTPDRVQHMMYQFYDPEHPLYDAGAAAQRMTFFGREIALSEAIPAIYSEVDRLVGEVRSRLAPEDVLILCSDHGFQSFRRQVHLNNWLHEKGYLATKPRLSKAGSSLVTSYVDWSRTRAYSIGLGMVYVNLEGRESGGIVKPGEVDGLLESIRGGFLSATDPDSGQRIGRSAHRASEIHSGPFLEREADLLLGFEAGYRVSWNTTGGGLEVQQDSSGAWVVAPAIEDNDKNWSGDHVSVDPDLVRGIFFSSRKLNVPPDGPDLRHMAPTVLRLLGVPVPEECDLPALTDG